MDLKFAGDELAPKKALTYSASPRWRGVGMWMLMVPAFVAISTVAELLAAQMPVMLLLPLGVLALILGGVIVLRAMSGSRGALMLYLGIIAFVTDAQFRARGNGDISTDWQSLMKFGLWFSTGLIGFARMPPIREIIVRPIPALWLFFIAVCLCSTIYSPTPAYTFGDAVILLCFLSFAFALAMDLSIEEILWTLMWAKVPFLLISWVVYYKYPELGTSEAWTVNGMELRMGGLAGQATNLGDVCCAFLGSLFLLWWYRAVRFVYVIPFAMLGIVTFVASDARSAMISFVVGTVGVMLLRSVPAVVSALLAAILGAAAFLLLSLPIGGVIGGFSRSGDPGEMLTVNGRMQIWDFVWDKIVERPILGWGYNSTKVLLAQHSGFSNDLAVDTAHNMFLQCLVCVGVVGTAALMAILLIMIFQYVLRPDPFRNLILVIVLITGMSEAGVAGTTPTLLTMLLMLASIRVVQPASLPDPVRDAAPAMRRMVPRVQ